MFELEVVPGHLVDGPMPDRGDAHDPTGSRSFERTEQPAGQEIVAQDPQADHPPWVAHHHPRQPGKGVLEARVVIAGFGLVRSSSVCKVRAPFTLRVELS
jgi:hypothetical protein